MPDSLIELSGLTKRYGNHTAVDGLNLAIQQGEIFGLLGPNGAGKTTTILMMLGLAEPTSGTVYVKGLDPARSPLETKRIIGYMPDDIGFYEDMNALDNLMFTARLNRIPEAEARKRACELLNRVGLSGHLDKKVGAFSRGMRQRLGLADVLVKSPAIIILDEPTLGIDPEGVRELLQLIRSLSRNEGLTVLLSSHHLHQVQQICDRVGLFVNGKLIASGTVADLSQALDETGEVMVELELEGDVNLAVAALEDVQGIKHIWKDNPGQSGSGASVIRMQLACDSDLSAEIARTVLAHNVSLRMLRRRVYGLDDIYRRYFEGGNASEVH